MFLIVRTSDLSSLARRASVLPHRSLTGPFGAPPRLAPARIHDRMLEGDGLVGCCGCVAPDGFGLDAIGQEMPRAPEPIGAVAAPMSPEPMGFAPPPPPFSPDPERARFVPGIEDVERERERFEQRLAALLPAVEHALGRDETSKRAERASEDALEEAEDRAFAALVELLMIARSEARALRRARRA